MLNHPQISLHCLNAPHAAANGVIPLSMAASLNFPDLVQLLLEESADTVALDGLDAHGATALMCPYLFNFCNSRLFILSTTCVRVCVPDMHPITFHYLC